LLLSTPMRQTLGRAPPDLKAEDVVVPSPAGSALRGWLIRGRPGNWGRRPAAWRTSQPVLDDLAPEVAVAGRLCRARERFPGAWRESRRYRHLRHLEALDARAAVDFARSALPGERVGAIGVSLRGAAALLAPAPLPVDALVVESVYPKIENALGNRFVCYLGPAGTVIAPTFAMSATDDRYTTLAESQALYARAPEPKQFWAVDGAAHLELVAYAPAEYRRRILEFLGK
jgi:uncharacterized protein